ncbi:MAG: hypothetical protein K9K76_01165 [Halanaerobiales bacterium]|nr:hypothetical protein [Halanaerobiales bacterium]
MWTKNSTNGFVEINDSSDAIISLKSKKGNVENNNLLTKTTIEFDNINNKDELFQIMF